MRQWQRRWWKKIQMTLLVGTMLGLAAGMPVSADDDDDHDDFPERNWELMIGAGTMGQPTYAGADDLTFTPLPIIMAFYETRAFRLFLEGDEAGAALKFGDDIPVALLAGIGLGEGRENDEADILKGLPTLKNKYRLFGGLSLELPWGVELDARAQYFPITAEYDAEARRADLEYDGILTALEAEWGWMKIPFLVRVGGGCAWMNQDYADANYGVSQPAAHVKAFQAGSGLHDVHLSTQVIMFFSERLGVAALAKGTYLLSDAADSPFTRKAFQPSIGAFAFYRL